MIFYPLVFSPASFDSCVIPNTCISVLNIDEMNFFRLFSKGEKIFIQALFTEIFLECVFFF